MPSSYDPLLRVEEQAAGENLNTWGTKLNAQTTTLLAFAIAGYTSLTPSGPITLTSNNGAADQARSAILDCISGTGGTLTIPSVSHVYQVRNNCSGNVILTTGSGSTATVEPGSMATVFCDGTNCYRFADAADIAACLATSEAYTDAAAFASSSAVLPGQPGNAGKFLQTNGTTAGWALVGASGLATGAAASNIGYTSLNAASNLSDLASVSTARTNLGLGGAALLGVGTSAGTVAAGNDSRFSGLTQNSQSVAYGFVLSDAGGQVYHPSADTTARTWTIPANSSVAFPIGTKIEIVNDVSAGALTIAITSDTLVWFPGSTTGSRTLAAGGIATLTKIGATRWAIVGVNLT